MIENLCIQDSQVLQNDMTFIKLLCRSEVEVATIVFEQFKLKMHRPFRGHPSWISVPVKIYDTSSEPLEEYLH